MNDKKAAFCMKEEDRKSNFNVDVIFTILTEKKQKNWTSIKIQYSAWIIDSFLKGFSEKQKDDIMSSPFESLYKKLEKDQERWNRGWPCIYGTRFFSFQDEIQIGIPRG